ncbi:hypothetical protein SDC9_155390 [bioreactor metagenome]|uniref:Uncharacterized protein n=1 Tax=bioreactor metagenome TaxID=1076179 RepID=A0A645F3K1_9ZZZZ
MLIISPISGTLRKQPESPDNSPLSELTNRTFEPDAWADQSTGHANEATFVAMDSAVSPATTGMVPTIPLTFTVR